jgi:hypothetical protein
MEKTWVLVILLHVHGLDPGYFQLRSSELSYYINSCGKMISTLLFSPPFNNEFDLQNLIRQVKKLIVIWCIQAIPVEALVLIDSRTLWQCTQFRARTSSTDSGVSIESFSKNSTLDDATEILKFSVLFENSWLSIISSSAACSTPSCPPD